MLTWEREGYKVVEKEFDYDLHEFDVVQNGFIIGTITPSDIKEMESVKRDLDAGEDVDRWGDGKGSTIYIYENIVEQAEDMDEFNNNLPQLNTGDTVTLSDVWDGEGEVPESSYSYKLTDNDSLNYEFEVLETKKNALDTVVKITNIDFV